MSDSLSLWNLILNASWLAQLVMLSLFLISVMSWVIIVQKWIIISDAEKEVFSFEKRFWSGMDLSQLYRDGSTKQKNNTSMIGMENLFRSGFKEFTRLRQQPGIESDAVMEGAGRAMRVAWPGKRKCWKDTCLFWPRLLLYQFIWACSEPCGES